MSKEAERNKVFQTTRVRTAFKNDLSWIQKSKGQENERTDEAVETKPIPVRQNSYVLSTAKIFESVDSPLSPPLKTTKFIPSEGISADQANSEVITPQEDSQPEGSTVETTHDAESQAPTEELIQNGVAQIEKPIANAAEENKEESADTTVDQSNVELNEKGASEISADVQVEGCIQNGEVQPVSPPNENPEAVPPVQQAEQPVANTTADNKGENGGTTVDQLNVEHNDGTEVSGDVQVEACVQNDEAQPVSSANENAEAVSPVQPAEQPVADTTAENKEENAKTTVDQTDVAQNEVKVSADAYVEGPVAETGAVVGTEESKDIIEVPAAFADSQKPQEEPLSITEPADKTPLEDAGVESAVQSAEESHEKSPPEQVGEEIIEAVADVGVESSLDQSATPREEGTLQASVEPVPDLLLESVSESPIQSAAETATESTGETSPPEKTAEETVVPMAVVNVESVPETPVVTDAAEAPNSENSVEPVPDLVADTVPELPAQPAAETAVEAVESKAESATLAEPVLQSKAEEVVECEVQPAVSTVVKQSVEPTLESEANLVAETGVEDVVTPVTASGAEAVQDSLAYRPIELTDALNVQPPAAEAAPEPQKDPEQSQTKDTNLNQLVDQTSIPEILPKPAEKPKSTQTIKIRDGKAVCSYCDQIIDGNVKITFSEPLVCCHPDCLKCGTCAKALGDLLTPMFVHDQVIQCDGCFAKTL